MVLGHLQRGGSPRAGDRLLSLRYGAAAVRLAEEGPLGHDGRLRPAGDDGGAARRGAGVDEDACPVECDTVRTARELGISFGD